MSDYPSWWNTTLTIYNKYEDTTTRQVTWYKTVVSDCFWRYVGNRLVIGETKIDTNTTICRIPKNDNFMEKYLWISETNKENYFTLGRGDIIIKGTVTDTVNEYVSGKRSSDLLAKYKDLQGCMVVDTVAINTDGGRCAEHYLVKGI